ncbi:MAG: tetratricopeptide repeat protein [Candidatus Acidiferrum sp.]
MATEVTPGHDVREAGEILSVTSTVEQRPQLRSRWRFWIPRLAAAILIPVLLLALTEGALRLFHVGYSTSLMEPCVVHGQSTSCYNLFFAAPFFPPGIIKTPQFFSMSPQKPPGTYRIVVLGESAAMGDPDPAYGFSRYLEVMLRQRFPSTKFEVINTSMVAINSHVLRSIAQQLQNYRPDLVIIYAGNNEVVGPYGPGTVLASSSLNISIIRASIFVRSSRLGQLLTQAGSPRSEWRGMEMFLEKQVRADAPALQHTYENFSRNLEDVVQAAHAAGAKVFLSTVATNLKDCPPFSSLHREGLSSRALDEWTSLVKRGAALEDARSFADALKLYLEAAQIDNQYAELEFRIARCYWELGDHSSAKKFFLLAQDLDTLRFRADSRIDQIIRSVAKSSGQKVELLDAQSALASESHYGVIGSELLYEHVHLKPQGNYLLARAAFEKIISILPSESLGSTSSSEPLGESECERLLALTGHDRSRLAAEMAQRLQRPPFTTQMNHSQQIQNLLSTATGFTESFSETLSEYQWAIAQSPGDPILHYKFGFFLFDFDRNASAQQFLLARPVDNFPVFLPDGSLVQ